MEDILRDDIPDDAEQLMKKINSCLSVESSRLDGLHLLSKCIENSAENYFNNSILNLIANIQNYLVTGDIQIKNQTCKVLILLIEASKNSPDTFRSIGLLYIQPIVNNLLKSDHEWYTGALRCLKSAMNNFPTQCGKFKGNVERFILSCLTSNSQQTRIVAAECFALLCVCGSSGRNKANYITSWSTYCADLVATLHIILNDICSSIPSSDDAISSQTTNGTPLLLDSTSTDNKYVDLCAKFVTLCECVTQMFSSQLAIDIKVPQRLIFRFISRSIDISKFIMKKCDMKLTFMPFIPQIIISTMTVLKTLIYVLKTNLLPLGSLVNKLFVNSLLTCHDDSNLKLYFNTFCKARSTIYETLIVWLTTMGCASGVNNICNLLLTEIKLDVEISEKHVKLASKTPSDVNSNGKRNSKGHTNMLKQNVVPCNNSKSKLCFTALQVLASLLDVEGDSIPGSSLKDIHDVVVNLVLKVQKGRQEIVAEAYANAKCRLQLYSVLKLCALRQNGQYHISLSAIVRLMRIGLRDPSFSVAQECKLALSACETVVHPRTPSLRLAEEPIQREPQPTVIQPHANIQLLQAAHDNVNGSLFNATETYHFQASRNTKEDDQQSLSNVSWFTPPESQVTLRPVNNNDFEDLSPKKRARLSANESNEMNQPIRINHEDTYVNSVDDDLQFTSDNEQILEDSAEVTDYVTVNGTPSEKIEVKNDVMKNSKQVVARSEKEFDDDESIECVSDESEADLISMFVDTSPDE